MRITVCCMAVLGLACGGDDTVPPPPVTSDSEAPPPPPEVVPCAYAHDGEDVERRGLDEAPPIGDMVEALRALAPSQSAVWSFDDGVTPEFDTALSLGFVLDEGLVNVLETRFVASTDEPERCPDLYSWEVEIPLLDLSTTDGDLSPSVENGSVAVQCVSAVPEVAVDGLEGPLCDVDLLFEVSVDVSNNPFRYDGDPMGPILASIEIVLSEQTWSAQVLQFPGETTSGGGEPTGEPSVLLVTTGETSASESTP